MAETERRMRKGFVTAASLSSDDIGATDKPVSELWYLALDPVRKQLTPLICHCRLPTVRAEEEGATRGAGRMDPHQRIATRLPR